MTLDEARQRARALWPARRIDRGDTVEEGFAWMWGGARFLGIRHVSTHVKAIYEDFVTRIGPCKTWEEAFMEAERKEEKP